MKIIPMSSVLSATTMLTLVLVVLSGCSKNADSGQSADLSLAPMDGMPAEVREAPTLVRQAYQFAAANPDILKQIPCYCGCEGIGHRSNYVCYVTSVEASGKVDYDPHALGCSICVDITQDTMCLLQQGESISNVKEIIDQTYSQYGSTNLP